MDRNTVGWLVLVASVIVIGFAAYAVQADVLGNALGLSTLLWVGVLFAGLFGVHRGLSRLDNPRRGLIAALGIFVVFMASALVSGWYMSRGGDSVASFSFYIVDANGKLVKAVPKSAFGLSLWAGDTELYDQFSIVYDCVAHVKDSPYRPAYLSFSQNLYVFDPDSRKWIYSTGSQSSARVPYRTSTASWNEVVQYHTSGWVSDGTNRWKIVVGSGSYSKLVAATVTKNDGLWNIKSKFKFSVGLVAQTTVNGVGIKSSEIASPMFEIEKKGDPLSASIWLDNVNWGVSGEQQPSGGQI